MGNRLVRQGGQLQQQSQESINQLAAKQGVAAPTPAGAKALGATPTQAAAARTPNAMQGLRLQETQAGQQRLQGPRQTATGDEVATQLRADRLKQLGELGPRVQGLIDQRLQQLTQQQAALSVNQGYLNQQVTDPVKQAEAAAKLQAYLTTGNETAALDVARVLGIESLSPDQIKAYYTGPEEALANVGKAITPESITLGDLDLTTLGQSPEQLAADLGLAPDVVAGMTVDQLQAQIDAVQSQAFSRIENLKAELPTATGNRAQQIRAELADLGAVGVTGLEAGVESLESQLDQASTVTIGGESYSLDDVLKNDAISSLISDAASSPETLAALKAEEPELATWIETNMKALQDVVTARGATGTEVIKTQDAATQARAEAGPIGTALVPELNNELMTAEELAAAQTALADSPVWQASQENIAIRDALTNNPELVRKFADEDWSAEELNQAAELATTIGSTPLLQAMGLKVPESGMITDMEELDTVADLARLATDLGPLANDPTLLGYVQAGKLKPSHLDQMLTLAENGGDLAAVWSRVSKNIADRDELEKLQLIQDPITGAWRQPKSSAEQRGVADKLLNELMPGQSFDNVAKTMVAYANHPDPAYQKIAEKLKKFLDADGDGTVNPVKDSKALGKELGKQMLPTDSLDDVITSGGQPVGQSALFSSIAKLLGKTPQQVKAEADKAKAEKEAALVASGQAKMKAEKETQLAEADITGRLLIPSDIQSTVNPGAKADWSAIKYDPASKKFTMPELRWTGGSYGGQGLNSLQLFDPETGKPANFQLGDVNLLANEVQKRIKEAPTDAAKSPYRRLAAALVKFKSEWQELSGQDWNETFG